MSITAFTAMISVIAAISGVMLGWAGRERSVKSEAKSDASSSAVLHTDVEYIKRGVDDIRLEQRAQRSQIDDLTVRVAKLDESAKSLHKRVDRLERIEDKEGVGR
ncbi:MAG: hypothetical protein K6T85_10830 [Gorillibacterium sp.]|nr:hypothetical protein [Gorillibacterium sp.]